MTNNQNQTNYAQNVAIIRSICGAPNKNSLSEYGVERFGNYFWNGSLGCSDIVTRVFVPRPEGGVRELTDIWDVKGSNYAHTETQYKGSVKSADVPEGAIIYQSVISDWSGSEPKEGVYVGPKVGMLCYDAC